MIVLTLPYPIECVEFDGARLKNGGYGAVRHEGKVVRAHRLAYCQANGVTLASIDGLKVRHSCDNPPCVNPAHLLIGTHTDNMRDMFERNRRQAAVGTKVATSKLTEALVREIRAARAAGQTTRSIASQFNLVSSTVSRIATRKGWSHVE